MSPSKGPRGGGRALWGQEGKERTSNFQRSTSNVQLGEKNVSPAPRDFGRSSARVVAMAAAAAKAKLLASSLQSESKSRHSSQATPHKRSHAMYLLCSSVGR